MSQKKNNKVIPITPQKTPSVANVNLANFLSLLRLISAPVIVWMLITKHYKEAFILFLLAGVSDALDGIVARLMKTKTVLGEYLDPLADKILVACVYFTLGSQNFIPLWLMILVLFRDFLIVAGIIIAALFHSVPLKIQPIFISKLNTALQLFLVFLVLADLSIIDIDMKQITWGLSRLIAATTILSGIFYGRSWLRHMNQ